MSEGKCNTARVSRTFSAFLLDPSYFYYTGSGTSTALNLTPGYVTTLKKHPLANTCLMHSYVFALRWAYRVLTAGYTYQGMATIH